MTTLVKHNKAGVDWTAIKLLYVHDGWGVNELARHFNVGAATISDTKKAEG